MGSEEGAARASAAGGGGLAFVVVVVAARRACAADLVCLDMVIDENLFPCVLDVKCLCSIIIQGRRRVDARVSD